MSISAVKIRARIDVGGVSVSTPFIQSFNVRKQRGQVSTFDASLKVSHTDVGDLSSGSEVKIYAGAGGYSLIFTGICRAAKISPCYDDPKYVILSISGADCLSLLQGKRYTRRCRATKSTWVSITGVSREGLKSGKFAHSPAPAIIINTDPLKESYTIGNVGSEGNNPATSTKQAPQGKNLTPVQIIAQIQNSTDPSVE